MDLEQSEFSDQEPILPDSLDNATAFFYAVSQLIRSTASEISGTLASNEPGFTTRLLDRLGLCIRDIVVRAVGWIRRGGELSPSVRKV